MKRRRSDSAGRIVAGLVGVAVLLAPACSRQEEIVPTDLRWEPDIRPLVERACLPCHSRADSLKGPNAHGLNLETYERVHRKRKQIRSSVVLERTMPETNTVGIALRPEEVARIEEWLRGGAPR